MDIKVIEDEASHTPKAATLDFVVKEYIGSEVYKDPKNLVPLKNEADIKVGDLIYGLTPNGDLYPFEVKKREPGVLYGVSSSGGLGCTLGFDKDDRHCWVQTGLCNLAALARIKFT